MTSSIAAMAKPQGSAILTLYRLFGSLVVRPLAPIIFRYRLSRGKEEKSRLNERYGYASAERPAGRVIWIHAASVGETNAVIPLIRHLVADRKSVVLTTVAVTAARIAASRLPEGAVHQYSPIDVAGCLNRFLAHWQPECALFVESELWPQSMACLDQAGTPLVVVNGRLSGRSFDGWQRHGRVARNIFPRIDLCLAQTERDAKRYKALGVADVRVTGNLKFDTAPPGVDPDKLEAVKVMLTGRTVWLAASTHPGEEQLVAEAHRDIARTHPDLLTIIAPRHPDRGAEICEELRRLGFRIAQRSRDDVVDSETDIYVADTLSELGLFFRLAPVAFLGGSLVPIGGHNPFEPTGLDTAILFGPHTDNFKEVFDALDQSIESTRIANTMELATGVASFLDDDERRQRAVEEAQLALARFGGALERTIDALAAVGAPSDETGASRRLPLASATP